MADRSRNYPLWIAIALVVLYVGALGPANGLDVVLGLLGTVAQEKV